MLTFVTAAVLLATQSPDDVAARRAAAERFLGIRIQSCESATTGSLEGWPGGESVAVETHIFFVQEADDELLQEQRRAALDMIKGVLQPLGVSATSEASGQPPATLTFIGIAEALAPADARGDGVFNGTSWRGAVSLHAPGKCVFARRFENRVQPTGSNAITVASASDAPFLDSLEPALIDALLAVVETIRGQAGLARVANSDADSRACVQAVARITDQAMLTGLARTAKATWVRVAAVGKLQDVSRLAAIAKADSSPEVRQAALARIAELKQKRP